jgi:type I restriction enzyme R subunit
LAWKLFHSRWNLTDWRAGLLKGQQPSRRPRILFLADRNILADQAFNAFSAFPEDALVRIDPQVIRKKGQVPKNGSVFFTIFQTFMTGYDYKTEEAKPNFGDYPPDFFDFIIIDECHRGGASDESSWRGILDYFAPAVQLGLTATPKREANADTYAYFGEPVYVYSLKEGINDGFLTPFKVKQVSTTLDSYIFTPDDEVLEGEVEEGKVYEEEDFNKIIEIQERERKRVEIMLAEIDQTQKTLVFCATQRHAAAVRNLINQGADSTDPFYCVRVTANDGTEGERFLRTFQDNEKTIPTVLTTSKKLSTGVDARNVRNIVLMRAVKSMIEFKQIVGRGTRLFDGKEYFTIYDYVEAYKHFSDPEWDGEPLEPEVCATCGNSPCTCEKVPPEPCEICGERPCVCEKPPPEPCEICGESPCVCNRKKKVKVKLADGKCRQIQHMIATSFWSADGKPVSAQEFMEQLFGDLPLLFKNEEELRTLWSRPDTRKRLLEGLAEKGYDESQLEELSRLIGAEDSDLYDVLAYIAYATATQTRSERVTRRRQDIFTHYDDKQQEFLDFVLEHYIQAGVGELDQDKLPHLLDLKYGGPHDAVSALGNAKVIREVFVGFQAYLYAGSGEVAS